MSYVIVSIVVAVCVFTLCYVLHKRIMTVKKFNENEIQVYLNSMIYQSLNNPILDLKSKYDIILSYTRREEKDYDSVFAKGVICVIEAQKECLIKSEKNGSEK